ncbi:DHH family phosphoesterase, partial [Candidatus Woesearchaeota archaeon]|nr:DHH family phosphoesterase [Candidatus Woesearchaeota archaeon]
SVSTIQNLDKKVLKELALEPYKCFVFTDLASGLITEISEVLKGRKVFILDHHEPEIKSPDFKDIVIVNPHLAGIDGGREISGSGVVYMFARELDKNMEDFAHVALIGAIGDSQENNGFTHLNSKILDTAIKRKKIEVKRGLRLFGAQTRPLHKVLEYSTDPYIPGISGSESGAIQFLQQIGIQPKNGNGNGWKKVVHLTETEMKGLVTGIILQRLGETNPEDVLGNIYILTEEKEESPTREIKEFATLLNACGRMGKASLGIGACLGDSKIKEKAIRSMDDYKKEIINAMRWYDSNAGSEHVVKKDGFMIINARDQIMPTLIGTIASMISKSNTLKKGTFVLSMANALDGNTKISLRVAGRNDNSDLKSVMEGMVKGISGCEVGGHQNAAGALIPTSKEAEFLETARNALEKISAEERVL